MLFTHSQHHDRVKWLLSGLIKYVDCFDITDITVRKYISRKLNADKYLKNKQNTFCVSVLLYDGLGTWTTF